MLSHLNATPTKPDRVVVIGACGFVGGAVVLRAEQAGIAVLRLGRGEIDLLAADAAERLGAVLRPGDAVVAAAAIAPCKTPAMLRDNVALTLALSTALARHDLAQIVNISSDAVYADSDRPMTEAFCAEPGSLHGVMHLAREMMLKATVAAPLVTLRSTLIYGAADPHGGYGPNQFRRKANREKEITLFGAGEELRDHVTIDDVAELTIRVILHRSIGTLNIATGVVTSFAEIARRVVALSGRSVGIHETPRGGPMPHNGYRAFDPAATLAAFPDFTYTALAHGLAAAQAEEFPNG